MLITAIISFAIQDGVAIEISAAGFITLSTGALLMFIAKDYKRDIKKREGYLVVTLGWLVMTFSGMLPYLISGAIPSVTNAFFETISGYTTTGATILEDIEALPKSLLFWRSTTHWIGGMGIIVLAIAILPLLGIGGMQLFAAEAPGPSADKLHPRITDTAKRLWLIYVGFTVAETIALNIAGMSFFDAINHAMSTLSTGGFSTKNASVAFWNDRPIIQYIIMLFMFLAGTNFVLSYFAFKGRVQKIIQDEEFKLFGTFILGFSLLVFGVVYFSSQLGNSSISHPLVFGAGESALRHALFQVLAVITTTGFVTADFTAWTPFLSVIFFGFMFLGGSAGSTAGGIKVVRHYITIKNAFVEFRRTLHPNAILPVRYNSKAIDRTIVFNILAFFILYMLAWIVGASVLGALGLDFETALGGAASALGNVGPAFGDLSPVDNYNSLPKLAKLWCAFLMLIGRLELFTVLILFTPFFWRNR